MEKAGSTIDTADKIKSRENLQPGARRAFQFRSQAHTEVQTESLCFEDFARFLTGRGR
jgi:hypothetical protein